MSIVIDTVTPAHQLERVKQLNQERNWGFAEADFPEVPADTTLNEGEVLLLAVYLPHQGRQSGLQRTLEELWDLPGYWKGLRSDVKQLLLIPGYDYRPGIRWLVFNPNAYHGLSPTDALARAQADNVRLAGLEVLMALVQFPDWAASWDGFTNPYPWLSGLRFNWDPWSSLVPNLSQQGFGGLRFFHADWSASADASWGSPSFREY